MSSYIIKRMARLFNLYCIIFLSKEQRLFMQHINSIVKKILGRRRRKGQNISDFYNFHEQIGCGAEGTVFKVTSKNGTKQSRAAKCISKKKINQKQLENQIELISCLNHPNTLKLYQIFEDAQNFYLITDLYEGGELYERIVNDKGFSESQASNILRQILNSIRYCHRQKIAHRDIKPQNYIFVRKQSKRLCLVDFGVSYRWKDSMNTEMYTLFKQKGHKLYGTISYISPEVIIGVYDHRCDIWSAGVILYMLICGQLPFNGRTEQDTLDDIKECFFTMDHFKFKKVSKQCKDLIQKMLKPVSQRITMDGIYKHQWFNKFANEEIPINIDKIFHRIHRFYKFSQLLKFLSMIHAYLIPVKQLQNISSLFCTLDKNCDGFISHEDLTAYIEANGQSFSCKQLLFEQSHPISYLQFVASTIDISVLSDLSTMENIFRILNPRNKQFITKIQLLQQLQDNLCSSISKNQLQQIFKTYNLDIVSPKHLIEILMVQINN